MSTKTSPYTPLDPSHREIRLLTLRPGPQNSPLTCTLSTVSLTSSPPPTYAALSYVWGEPSRCAPASPSITLDSSDWAVTPNLFAALLHIRPAEGDTALEIWIDAVCINQADLDERSAQVGMMRDIYAGAAEVVIWLGEGDEESDGAFGGLEDVGDGESWVWKGGGGEDDGDEDVKRKILKMHCGSFFFTLMDRRPWFSRVWILQELGMARNDPVVVCGWKRASWTVLVAAWEKIADDLLLPFGSRPHPHPSPSSAPKQERLSLSKLDLMHNLRQTILTHGGESLHKLLFLSRSSEATDPRDRIYALLGLLERPTPTDQTTSSTPTPIPIDYKKSTTEVYTDALTYILSLPSGPSFLTGIYPSGPSTPAPHPPFQPPPPKPHILPSWLPDFSRQTAPKATLPPNMIFKPPSPRSASGAGSDAVNGVILPDRRTLVLRGLRVDVVDRVVGMGESVRDVVARLPELDDVVREVRQRPCLFDEGVAAQMKRFRDAEPLWRVLISNMDARNGYGVAPGEYEETYRSYVRREGRAYEAFVRDEYGDDREREGFQIGLRSCCEARKAFFTTGSGFVGMGGGGSEGVREGDLVVVVFGAPSLFVLREMDGERGEDGEKVYGLVGGAYVGGVMEGGLVDELYCEDLMDEVGFLIR